MAPRPRTVAFVASREALDLDDGWPLVRDAVRAAGLEPAVLVWDAAAVAWAAAQRHVEDLHRRGMTVMVQPYLDAVDMQGETALISFGGRHSHAIGKRGLLEPDAGPVFGLWEREVVAPCTPRPDQHALAERAPGFVHARFGPTAYARVDLVDGDDGRPM